MRLAPIQNYKKTLMNIRFRAWNVGKKMWRYFDLEGISFSDPRDWKEVDLIHAQESLGFTNKKGQEIFEGDILRDPRVRVIRHHHKPRFTVEYPGAFCADDFSSWDQVDVISNTYENHELLH